MSFGERGLYTNEDGSEVVTLLNIWPLTKFCTCQVIFPNVKVRGVVNMYVHKSWKNFSKKYPIKVTGVKIEKGAKKAKNVVDGALYTDGQSVVRVRSHSNTVYYTMEVPSIRAITAAPTLEDFLKAYPWELTEVEICHDTE